MKAQRKLSILGVLCRVYAVHAVAHVYEMQGRRYEGQRLLRDSRWFWSEANLLHCHLQWHWALFQLEEGQFERAFLRYDWWIRENHSAEALDLVDAASLLWRLELSGNHVFDRWEELVSSALKSIPWLLKNQHDSTTICIASCLELLHVLFCRFHSSNNICTSTALFLWISTLV